MDTVSKKMIVTRLAAKFEGRIEKVMLTALVQCVIDELGESLVNGDRIELRDFGVFTPRPRAARKARNPKTGTVVDVPATVGVAFKVGKELRMKLDQAAKVIVTPSQGSQSGA